MPYIERERRRLVAASAARSAKGAGELNYQITMLCLAYLETNGLSYTTLNDIGGALSYCDKEFYRRVVVPYETNKIYENGDVY